MLFKNLIIAVLLSFAAAGGVGYPACIVLCELACCGTAILPVALPIYLACAVKCPSVCLPGIAYCYGGSTSVKLSGKGETSVMNIKVGDTVWTNDGWSKVIHTQSFDGSYEFVDITAGVAPPCDASIGSTTLSVTVNHGVVLANNSRKDTWQVVPAHRVKVGHSIYTENGPKQVTRVTSSWQPRKFEIITASGNLFASNVLTTTMCDQEVDTFVGYSDKTSDWKRRHGLRAS